jgi:hypothetical protein
MVAWKISITRPPGASINPSFFGLPGRGKSHLVCVESHDNIPKIQPKIPRTFAQVKFFRCIILRIKKRFVLHRQQEPLYACHPPPPFWGGIRGGACVIILVETQISKKRRNNTCPNGIH